jgi:hypothetical protein
MNMQSYQFREYGFEAETMFYFKLNMGERPTDFDAKDLDIFLGRYRARRKLKELLVGDRVIDSEGSKRIVSHVWQDSVQTSKGGSMHVSRGGKADFSGGLDSSRPIELFVPTDEWDMVPGFWFFHHERSGAHRGAYFSMRVRVWRYEGVLLTPIL